MDIREITNIQDEIMYRRASAAELQRLSSEIEQLHTRALQRQGWLIPGLLSALLFGTVVDIGIVHQMAVSTRT